MPMCNFNGWRSRRSSEQKGGTRPPPNQIIHVEADPAVVIDDMWVAYWLEGTLTAEKRESELAAAAYTPKLTRIEPYGVP